MSATVTDWLDSVIPDVSGCPIKVAQRAILETTRDYCARSSVWQDELGPFGVVVDETSLSLGTYPDKEVVYALRVMTQDIVLTGLNQRPSLGDTRNYSKQAGYPAYYRTMDQPKTVYWHPSVPSTFSDPVYVLCSMAPLLDTAASFTSGLLSHPHYQAISRGSIGRLQAMADKPWSNPVLSRANMKEFMAAAMKAKDMANRQFTTTDTAWRYPAWA